MNTKDFQPLRAKPEPLALLIKTMKADAAAPALAGATGLSIRTAERLLAGKTVSASTIMIVCDHFGCDLAELFEPAHDETRPPPRSVPPPRPASPLNNPPTPLPGSVRDPGPGRQAASTVASGLPQRLGTAVEQLAHDRRNVAAHDEVTPSSLAALAVLCAAVPLRISDLAARTAVGLPAMSRIVDYLDRHDWVARHPDPTDHRACLVSITQAGIELLDTVRRERAGRLSAGLTHLPPPQVDALLAALPAMESVADQITTA